MKKRLISVMTVLMAVSLAACTPTIEEQKKGATVATTARSQGDMVPPSTGRADDKVSDPNVMPVAVISTHHGGDGNLVQDMDSLDTEDLDVQLLVDKLVEYGVLTGGTEILNFGIEGKDKNAVGILDLSQAESAKDCSDKVFLTEIGNTSTESFELSKLKLKVNSGNYEGDDIKQEGSDYLTYNTDYEPVE